MSQRALLAVVALLVAAVPAVPAVLAVSARGGEAPTPWEEGVRALLERRAAAVESRDRDVFMATVDPEADAEFVDAQRRLFDGLVTVPFERYELVLRSEDVRDLSAGVRRDTGAAEVRLPLTEERHRVAGIDTTDAAGNLWYTYARRGDQWFVNGDSDLADLGLRTQRHLWSFGPVSLTEGDRTAVMSSPDNVERAAEVLEITEEAFDRLRETLDWEAPRKVLVVVPDSTDQLEEILQTNFDLTNFVAFATSDVDRTDEVGGWAWTSPRVYAQETNLTRHSRAFQIETLHHELVHAVAFERAGPNIPNWLHEGHADYLALGRPRAAAVSGTDGELPLDFEFVTGGRDRILRSYRESTSAVAFLAAEAGPEAPSSLFEVLGAVRIEPGTWRYHLDQKLRDVYGEGLEKFEADWNGGR